MARTTRSHSSNEEPRYFSKHGHADQAPNKTKRDGAGKLNWGKEGDEIADLIASGEVTMMKGRRRSSNAQSSGVPAWEVKPKYDAEVFEDGQKVY